MFDETSIFSQNNHTTIECHQATADETIRIYKELEEKAKANILKSITLNVNNSLNVKYVQFAIDASNYDMKYNSMLIFSINNTEYKIECNVDVNDVLHDQNIAHQISDCICNEIFKINKVSDNHYNTVKLLM